MSTQSNNHHHILPLSLYLKVGAALLTLTVLTIVVARLDLGVFNTILAMVIAVAKASLVALFFMHLKYDNKLYAVVFVGSLAFLGLFIILSMADTETRGDLDPISENPIVREAVIYRDSTHFKQSHGEGEHEGEASESETGVAAGADSAGISDSTSAQSSESTTPAGH